MSIFRDIGEALYGVGGSPAWHYRLADDLGVTSRNVRRWEAGTLSPPPEVYRELLTMIEARVNELDSIYGRVYLAHRGASNAET